MGSDDLLEYMRKYNLTLNAYYQQRLERYAKKPLRSFANVENKHLVSEEAIDLLEKMLVYDKNERITPAEAIKHPYFKSITEQKDDDYKE